MDNTEIFVLLQKMESEINNRLDKLFDLIGKHDDRMNEMEKDIAVIQNRMLEHDKQTAGIVDSFARSQTEVDKKIEAVKKRPLEWLKNIGVMIGFVLSALALLKAMRIV